MNGHLVLTVTVVEGDVRVMQEVVGKPLLDILLLVTSTDDKLGMAIIGILLHDMPKDRHTANLNHWLWLELAFFADTRAEATG